MKIEWKAVLFPRLDITQTTLFMTKSYIGQSMNDERNSFVTVTMSQDCRV